MKRFINRAVGGLLFGPPCSYAYLLTYLLILFYRACKTPRRAFGHVTVRAYSYTTTKARLRATYFGVVASRRRKAVGKVSPA